jgi:hypothetical protein
VSASSRPFVELDRACCAAGETVVGTVASIAKSASVALVRVERRPRAVRDFIVAEADVMPADGGFALTVPWGAIPTAIGERCATFYVASAGTPHNATSAELVVLASARPHLDAGSWRADRLLSSWNARHFHLELTQADVRGGGTLGGRVHRHGPWRAGAITVTARCLECWRSSAVAERGMPQWHATPLWEAEQALQVDWVGTWARFCFELPRELPPAVEARTIAWRYELVARRNVRHWFDETAALTPLLHEEAMR